LEGLPEAAIDHPTTALHRFADGTLEAAAVAVPIDGLTFDDAGRKFPMAHLVQVFYTVKR